MIIFRQERFLATRGNGASVPNAVTLTPGPSPRGRGEKSVAAAPETDVRFTSSGGGLREPDLLEFVLLVIGGRPGGVVY